MYFILQSVASTETPARHGSMSGGGEVEDLAWTSSRDGRLGIGRIIHPQLSRGRHRIILRAGRGNRAGEALITLDVVETPRR